MVFLDPLRIDSNEILSAVEPALRLHTGLHEARDFAFCGKNFFAKRYIAGFSGVYIMVCCCDLLGESREFRVEFGAALLEVAEANACREEIQRSQFIAMRLVALGFASLPLE